MFERVVATSPHYDNWVEKQKISFSFYAGEEELIKKGEVTPLVDRAKADLAIIFNALPTNYREYIKNHAKKLTISEIAKFTGRLQGKVFCPVTDIFRSPLKVTIKHEYYYRELGISDDSRYFEFEAVFPDSGSSGESDGMRISEEVRLEIVDRDKDKLVNIVRVEIGEVVDNDNKSSISMHIDEFGVVELYVSGVDFDVAIKDIAQRFPEIGELVRPEKPYHAGHYSDAKKLWKLTTSNTQAEAFRNAVREQIVHKLGDYE